jgi:hypothetical protein
VSALAGPAAPIVVPIAASAVLAVWLYEIYKQSYLRVSVVWWSHFDQYTCSNGTLRRLMAYIVDLTLIMQNLFWLAVIDRRAINRRLIKFAFKAYEESREKAQVHSDISDFVKQAGVFDRGSRDNVLDKIVELIGRNRIESAEMRSLESRIGDVDFSGDDEAWDVETSV